MDNAPTTPPAAPAVAAPRIGIRPRELMREYGIGKHGLAILIKNEGHPKPIALGKRSSMFIRAEVDAWLDGRKAARGNA